MKKAGYFDNNDDDDKFDCKKEISKIVKVLIGLDIFKSIYVEENEHFHVIKMDYGSIYLDKSRDHDLIFSFIVSTSPSLTLFIVFNIQQVCKLNCKISDDFFIDPINKKIVFGKEASEAFRNKIIGSHIESRHNDYIMMDDSYGIEC